jgi:serine/threonine protein kinase
MEPGVKLLQSFGGLGKIPQEEQDLEPISALWTLIEFPSTLVNRVSPEIQREIFQFKPILVPNGQPMTLSLIGKIFDADRGGWDFITAALEPDPEKRPTSEQLLQHHWLR